jgi:hypothetical protein
MQRHDRQREQQLLFEQITQADLAPGASIGSKCSGTRSACASAAISATTPGRQSSRA